jgi:DNA-directed RNA polymerase beta' subunit
MAASWVLVSRAPSILPTSILAFHPARAGGRAVRLHPMACMPMNGDFDGDQVVVSLPLTEAGQAEAGELFSLPGHLRRAPEVLDWAVPKMAAVWGLAELSRTADGLAEINKLATVAVAAPQDVVTRRSLVAAMTEVLARDGAKKALAVIESLMDRGFETARASGASLSPFPGDMDLPAPPADPDDHAAWEAYEADLDERIASRSDFDAEDLGPQLLALRSGARGNLAQMRTLLAPARIVDVSDRLFATGRGLGDGLDAVDYFTRCVGARKGLAQISLEATRRAYGVGPAARTPAFTVLGRAMRSPRPGIVFAHAAAVGEADPLTDLDTRLFVGLPGGE